MAGAWKFWTGLAISALTGVSSSALAVHYVDAQDRREDRSSDMRLLALRIAADLEMFAARCSDIGDSYDGGANSVLPQIPSLPSWELNDRWRFLPLDIVSRLWAMPVKRLDALSYVASAVRYTDRATAARATRDEAVVLGAEAWQIASKLRAAYGIPKSRISDRLGQPLVDQRELVAQRWHEERGPEVIRD